MAITLTKDAVTLELPEDLFWIDEFSWAKVAQSTDRGTTGKLLVDVAVREGGRPITLQGEGNTAWIKRSALKELAAWSQLPGQQFAMSLRGEAFTVIFDHGEAEETKAINQAAVINFSDIGDDDFYCSLVLRFLEI
jgi:hypothetical protein